MLLCVSICLSITLVQENRKKRSNKNYPGRAILENIGEKYNNKEINLKKIIMVPKSH